MKQIFLILTIYTCLNNLVYGQNQKSLFDSSKHQNNYSKYNGLIRPEGIDTIKQKDYYIEQHGSSLLMTFPENTSITIQNIFERAKGILVKNDLTQFIFTKKEVDNAGFNVYSYEEYYNGIKVSGGYYKINERSNGKIFSVTGRNISGLSINIIPKLSAEDALHFAKSDFSSFFDENTISTLRFSNTLPELLLVPKTSLYDADNYLLAYSFQLEESQTASSINYYIDANNGEVIKKFTNYMSSAATGNGQSIYSGNQSFTTEYNGSAFLLNDAARNIFIYNSNYSSISPVDIAGNFTDNDNNWSDQMADIISIDIYSINSGWDEFGLELHPDLYLKFFDKDNNFLFETDPQNDLILPFNFNVKGIVAYPFILEIWDKDLFGYDDDLVCGLFIDDALELASYTDGAASIQVHKRLTQNPAIDALYGLQKTYDFYLEKFGRNSYNGSHSPINAYINFSPNLLFDGAFCVNNAKFDPTYNSMIFGIGDGITYSPFVEFDVTGHEFTHQVIRNTSNLNYSNESGALNESFADIMGTSLEYYTKGITPSLWVLGQNFISNPFAYERSISNPNLSYQVEGWKQADTYHGNYYFPTDDTFWDTYYLGGIDPLVDYGNDASKDYGGVHFNSGVQNFWFYLISQGGTGINDLGQPYTVVPIGIDKAMEIAYNNFAFQLNETSTFIDAVNSSCAHTAGLYGFESSEYNSIRNAWYAVGLLDVPGYYCSGIQDLTDPTGTITDGSFASNYNNYVNCSWYIHPVGATTISLSFSEFYTELGHDSITVYDGNSILDPILLSWSGHGSLPPVINSTSGEMLIVFKSDGDINDLGWTAVYTSTTSIVNCSGLTVMTGSSGYLTDGSGPANYSNNNMCTWLIEPSFATTITLNFSAFNTESIYDYIKIYNGYNSGGTLLGTYSGSSIPSTITSTGPALFLQFVTDASITSSGWSIYYTTDGIDPITTSMSSYEYWFDNNYADDNTGTISGPSPYFNESIDVSTLSNGLHSLHIRFKDANNLWSSVITQFFVKVPQINTPNLISNYEYWFDSETYASVNSVSLLSPVTPCNWNDVIDVTDLSEANHTVHFRFQDINGVWSSVVTDTFSRVPFVKADFTVSPTSICAGSSVTFDNLSQNALTYLWNFGDGGTSTAYEPTHTYTTGGAYTVTLTATNVGLGISDVLTTPNAVTVIQPNPVITPGGPTTFCSGGSVLLSTGVGFTSYQWYKGAAPIAGATNSNYLTNKSGSYTVKVFQGTCFATSAPIIITVNALPNATITNLDGTNDLCFDTSIKLKANGGGGFTYQWLKGASLLAGATSQTYNAISTGNYKVKVTAATGCSKTSTALTIIKTCKLGDSIVEAEQLMVYPNPNDGKYTLVFNSECNDDIIITIYDAAGRLVLEESGKVEDNLFSKNYDLTGYAKGSYLVKVVCDEGAHYVNVVVQ